MRTTPELAFLVVAAAVSCQSRPDVSGQAALGESAAAARSSAHSGRHASAGSTRKPLAAADAATTPATPDGPQAVGSRLAGSRRVTVGEVLTRPHEYVGQTIRVEGEVIAMCHHRRTWFAVRDAGEYVRIQTTPAFLVPAGVIGRRAKAEGRLELVQVPATTARHYAAGHGLGDPKRVNGPVEAPVLVATGAEFD